MRGDITSEHLRVALRVLETYRASQEAKDAASRLLAHYLSGREGFPLVPDDFKGASEALGGVQDSVVVGVNDLGESASGGEQGRLDGGVLDLGNIDEVHAASGDAGVEVVPASDGNPERGRTSSIGVVAEAKP